VAQAGATGGGIQLPSVLLASLSNALADVPTSQATREDAATLRVRQDALLALAEATIEAWLRERLASPTGVGGLKAYDLVAVVQALAGIQDKRRTLQGQPSSWSAPSTKAKEGAPPPPLAPKAGGSLARVVEELARHAPGKAADA
jgi:hypothetical protein